MMEDKVKAPASSTTSAQFSSRPPIIASICRSRRIHDCIAPLALMTELSRKRRTKVMFVCIVSSLRG